MAPEIYPAGNDQPGSTQFQRERVVSTNPEQDQSLSGLISGLVADAQELVRKEIGLAKAEVKEEINKARDGAISLGVGVGVAAIGGIVLVFTLVYLLHEVAGLSLWLSHLIVGAVLTGIGAFLLMRGVNRLKTLDPMPHQTIESVQRDVEAIVPESLSSERK
jgi:hypothetical protein